MSAGFRVYCSCGAVYSGLRQAAQQILTCQKCQKAIFVLPRSPWATPGESLSTAPAKSFGNKKLVQLLAGASILLLIGGGIGFLMIQNIKDRPGGPPDVVSQEEKVREILAKAGQLLAQGQFRLAQKELQSQEYLLASATSNEALSWKQTLGQAQLLADLAPEPLEDIIRHAAGATTEGWLADFADRFQNKALVFDAVFRRPPHGAITGNYEVHLPGLDGVKLVFDNITCLQCVDWMENRRVILGVRLASIRLEPPGPLWVVRFDPDQCVLLTDPGAAASLCPEFADPEVRKHLDLQAAWLADWNKNKSKRSADNAW